MDGGAYAKLTAAVVLGSFTAWLSGIWIFIEITFVAIVLDYISGFIAGCVNEGPKSKRAFKGLYKKVGIFMLLCLGLFLDGTINYLLPEKLDFFEMPIHAPIAHIVTIWIVITEAISICENLERVGVPIPVWMLKMLRKAEKEIDATGDDYPKV